MRGRRRRVDAAYVTARSAGARRFFEVAALVADEEGFEQAASALYVLAGIAAADAICGHRLGEISRGQDHRQAVSLLSEVRETDESAKALGRLLDLKDAAHYGTSSLTADRLRRAHRDAMLLLEQMEAQLGR